MFIFNKIIHNYRQSANTRRVKMEDSSEYNLTRRLKATLANFHSYCQKRSQQHSEIRQVRSRSNKNITRYRSTRELRKLSESKLQVSKPPIKGKDNKDAAGQIMQMKTSDLIEIIKLKLNNNQGQRVKTDGNQNKNQGKSWKILKKFNSFQMNQYNKSFNLNDTLKKKKINLLVQNSRRKVSQKPLLRQRHIESFNVTLQNRPCSAIIKPSEFNTYKQPQNDISLKQKYSCQLLLKYHSRSSNYNKRENKKRKQVLSGWDLPLDEDFLSIENMNHRSLEKKRKKSS